MMDRATLVFAFIIFVGFLGILVVAVPRLDLGLITAATLLLVGCDMFVMLRKNHD
ncbi:MAG: hypothetical protein WD969_12605 [Paracoccaceae bacterium]